MELAREVAWGQVPADDPLPHLLLEPRMLRATSRDGLLARIVDIPAALMSRPYPEKAVLRFEVVDSMASWNTGIWQMDATASPTSCNIRSQSPPSGPTLTT
jgi:predicted acetyltransferase